MMNTHNNYFYKKLEIDEIFNNLLNYALLPNTKEFFSNLEEENDVDIIKKELDEVSEMMQIVISYERCPIYFNLDLEKLLNDAVKERILSGKELYEFVLLSSSIGANRRLLDSIKKNGKELKYYNHYIESLIVNLEFDKLLRKSLDEDGHILDDASKELKTIRNRLNNLDNKIKDKLNQLITSQSSYLADSTVVIRDNRYCLAVKSEFKNSFKGILHDVSNTMLTCFIEPIAVAELSNEKERLRNEEKMEEERILRNLTKSVSDNYDILKNNFSIFSRLDILFSKALLGKSFDGSCPKVNNNGYLKLVSARHPLLKVKKVIPNNLEFGKDYLGIVITGPNTGGKTVFLKTVGLLCLMTKFCLPIPAEKESDINIYDCILCDIGDDQSIQENLSTFSSHMKKMVKIVNTASSNSLVLFDEICSGTDPKEGSAIAESVLTYFLENQVSFIVTTHYANLKSFAYSNDKVINASMAFNDSTYKPTYELLIGRSGSSKALSIATTLGLKKEIIKRAKKSVTVDESSRLIHNIEVLSTNLHEKEKELNLLINEYKIKDAELSVKLDNIEKIKEQEIDKTKKKANEILEKAQEEANKLLEEINNAKNKNLKMHEEIELKTKINSLDDKKNSLDKKKKIKNNKDLKVGDRVFVSSFEQFGNIKRINRDKSYEIEIGNLTIKVEKDLLDKVDEEKFVNQNITFDTTNESHHLSLTLDLRGMRYDEAKEALDKYIDELLVAGLKSATIIHGYGTGTIREMVQDYLKKCKYIDSYRYGQGGEGGLGVTVITLK